MYLVTYLGQLCNGLTLLIISKEHTFPSGNICWKSIKRLYGCHVNYFPLFLPPPGVIAVFSLPLLYQRRQVVLQMFSLYRCFLQRFLLSFSYPLSFYSCHFTGGGGQLCWENPGQNWQHQGHVSMAPSSGMMLPSAQVYWHFVTDAVKYGGPTSWMYCNQRKHTAIDKRQATHVQLATQNLKYKLLQRDRGP